MDRKLFAQNSIFGHFDHFCPPRRAMRIFIKNPRMLNFLPLVVVTSCKISEKSNERFPIILITNERTNGRTDMRVNFKVQFPRKLGGPKRISIPYLTHEIDRKQQNIVSKYYQLNSWNQPDKSYPHLKIQECF